MKSKFLRSTSRSTRVLQVMTVLVLLLGATAQGQQPATDQSGVLAPLSKPLPQRTVGLDPGRVINWTLRDAILTALEKNVDIELERENVKLAGFDIVAASGAYDLTSTTTSLYESAKRPNSFPFSGTTDNFTLNDTFTFNSSVVQNIQKYGSRVEGFFQNRRVANNVNLFSPQYTPVVGVNLTQPLMRNLKIDTNRRQIMISRKRLDLSDAQFRQRAIEIISRVQQAYWDLAFAIKDEEIQRDAVRLAETQLDNNRRQVEVGTLAPIDVVSAATQVESRRQQALVAMNAVAQAENALKALTVDGADDQLWDARILPAERFEVNPVIVPLEDAVKLAQANRPEMRQLNLQKEINKVDIEFFRNQAKPQIDLLVNYSAVGLGGTPARAGAFPLFVGGYGTSLKNMLKNEFRTWSFGLQINLPLQNRAAKANLARARETTKQVDLQVRRQLQTIELEVRNAVQSVEISRMRIEAARSARQYAEKQLDGEEKKFAAGLSITYFILQRQTELAQARGVELRAMADYNKSIAELQRIISTTLTSNSIEIRDVPQVEVR
ncbi:MAG: TolC family protein [Acidobacteria bacterium]|nr:TolC family protein [Acidobacteriota bacterium]